MDNVTKSSLTKVLQKEFVRRTLIQYFENKGYHNFQVDAYPPTMVDIMERVDALSGIIEVTHSLEDVNMQNNEIKVGWNLFVLGNKRAFLGYTTHQNLTEIETAGNEAVQYNGPLTIKQLVEWIVESVGESSKLSDIYNNHNKARNGKNSIAGMNRPGKSMPNFKKRV